MTKSFLHLMKSSLNLPWLVIKLNDKERWTRFGQCCEMISAVSSVSFGLLTPKSNLRSLGICEMIFLTIKSDVKLLYIYNFRNPWRFFTMGIKEIAGAFKHDIVSDVSSLHLFTKLCNACEVIIVQKLGKEKRYQ